MKVSMADAEQDVESDSLWSQLPDGLLLTILACLPLRTLMQCRVVCRQWRALLLCPAFLKMRSYHAPPEKSWFTFTYLEALFLPNMARMQARCYDPEPPHRWIKFPLNFLPGTTGTVAATAGGLMLCVGVEEEYESVCLEPTIAFSKVPWNWKELFVYNPIRENAWVKLPSRLPSPSLGTSLPSPISILGILDIDTRAGIYKVVVATPHGTEVYDSRGSSWTVLGNCLAPGEPMISLSGTWTICYKHFLVTAGVSRGEPHRMPAGNLQMVGHAGFLWLFDPNEESWSSIELPEFLAQYIHLLQVEDCDGRLLLVAILGLYRDVLLNGRVFVWERVGENVKNGRWEEVCSRPLQEIRERSVRPETEESAKYMAAAPPNDLLCFALNRKILRAQTPDLSHVEGKRNIEGIQMMMLTYSLSQNSWCLVEERRSNHILFLDDSRKDRYIGGFASKSPRFFPRLEAEVRHVY